MAIIYTPFDELFASDYQLTYISTDGYIDVGPYAYSVFHAYTMAERQQIFQVCEKHLPWEYTQEQEQWERTMYMYQFVIKSPPPFPYEEYSLSEDIIMAIDWEFTITPLDVSRKEASITAVRIDDNDLENVKVETHTIVTAILNTNEQKIAALEIIWQSHLNYQTRQAAIDNFIGDLEATAKVNLEARE